MVTVTLRVEASHGINVKVGDSVRKGEKLGIALGFKGSVTSPVDGVVRSIDFDSDAHAFVIKIEEKKYRTKRWKEKSTHY